MRLQKERQIENKQKFNQKLPENAVEPIKPYSSLKICLIAPSSNTDNEVCDLSFMRLGNK